MVTVLEEVAPQRASGGTAKFSIIDGRIPIMLGGIGHRTFANKERIAEIIATESKKLKARYPNSPFVILSPLAEGADRLIAKVVVEHLDAELIAVLPMPRNEYEKDFASEESRAEFAALIGKATAVKVAPTPENDISWKEPGDERNALYARAGAIIADHAQILFAIWDSRPAKGTGGTADQVAWFDRGYAPSAYSLYGAQISPLDPPEPGLRIAIDPISLDVEEIVNPQAANRTKPDARRSNILSILKRTDRYNKDVLGHRSVIEGEGKDPAGECKSGLAASVFNAADRLSSHFASIARFNDAVIYGLAIIAIISFNFINKFPIAVSIYLVVTVVMLALFYWVRFRSVDNRFLEYRALAEPLRVFRFWRQTGVSRSVWLSYLARHDGVVHWLRHATRTVEFCQDSVSPPQKTTEHAIEAVKRDWVQDQLTWFSEKRLPEHERRWKRFRLFWRIVIGASFALSIALFLMTFLPARPFAPLFSFFGYTPEAGATLWQELVKPDDNGDLWQAVLAFLAASGLAARGYSQRRGDADMAKQYASQRRIFETANVMLREVGTPGTEWTAEQILERLGDEALQEQAEFVWLRHSRPFEMPQ
ncbi:hypothetical protein KKP04_03915 [Rhodomicrobium sp. Az07]|uniref:hypothetical protein n=1 Tax=Rhodomicrobium sp. Az07 TaxID=2839034 RepID=UPI001BE5B9A8|nr:hypothetical protein [Rhodomicrobium sp. Az07]MBT3070015.1 hypothetical protein [Rhodomicrobium sp. Az07]